MNCEEFKSHWLSDPHRLDAKARQHLAECMACTDYNRVGLQRESQLMGAFNVPVNDELTARMLAKTTPQRAARPARGKLVRRWLPMAAAACLAVVVGIQLRSVPSGLDGTGDSLASAVVEHIHHEPSALDGSLAAPAAEAVRNVMQSVGLVWEGAMDAIAYVQLCPFGDKTMAHVVVESDMGPVTVMLASDAEQKNIESAYGDWQLASVNINGSNAILAATNREALVMVENKLRAQLKLARTA